MPSISFTEWTQTLSSSAEDSAHALTTGSDGAIYISGYTEGDLDGQTNSGSYDAFISKYNSDGTKDWTKLLGSDARDSAHGITTGNDGSIYIAGYTQGNLDGQINSGDRDAFISKFNPDGTKDWTKLLGSDARDVAHALTTGSDGSIYIAGYTDGDLDGQINSGSDDAFISKFNPDGTKDWTRVLGGSSYDYGVALTTGSDGAIYIAGTTGSDLDGQTNSGDNDAFISKYNPDGTKEWTRLLGSSEDDTAYAITTGLYGSIYIAGSTDGDFDGETNSGGRDAFISKFNPDGTKEWTKLFGSSEDDSAGFLAAGLDGSIKVLHVTGNFDTENKLYISKFFDNGNTINENIEAGSIVANLSTNDANLEDTHTYSLVSGTGDTDNAAFTIEGSHLKINSSPDYETQSSYSILSLIHI